MHSIDQKLFQQTQHRFRILEVELIEASNAGHISHSDFQSRMMKLESAKAHAASIAEIAGGAKSNLDLDTRTLELPVLSDSSKLEQRIMFSTLKESNKILGEVSTDSERLLKCIQSVHSQKLNWVKLVIHLSWQRTKLMWVSRSLEKTRAMRRLLEDYIKRVTGGAATGSGSADLVETFREFEATTSRIATLKSKLHRENSKISDQTNWLKQLDQKRRSTRTNENPPIPAEFVHAKMQLESKLVASSLLAAERLVIARKLAHSLAGGDSVTHEHNLGNQDQAGSNQDVQKIVRMPKKERLAKKMRSKI